MKSEKRRVKSEEVVEPDYQIVTPMFYTAFLYGLRRYCEGFPQNNDLPPSMQGRELDPAHWQRAATVSLGGAGVQEQAVPLCSIFQHLIEPSKSDATYPMQSLSLDPEAIFPVDVPGEFQPLLEQFKKEWREGLLKILGEAFGDTMLFLAKKYLSNVGCSPSTPHISLFEYLKTTAAVADCQRRGENGNLLLVGVGLDGIQGFCYDIVRNRAARSMKGRSFYLQMILDGLAHAILSHQEVQCSSGHILYARGGKMYLILPDAPQVQAALLKVKDRVRDQLWKDHGTSLFLFFEYVSSPALGENIFIETAWGDLEQKIKQSKRKKFHSELTTKFTSLFEPIPEGFYAGDIREGKTQLCSVTGDVLKITASNLNECLLDEGNPEEEPTWVKPIVKIQSDIGQRLNKARTVAIDISGKLPKKIWLRPIGEPEYIGLLGSRDCIPQTAFVRSLNAPDTFLTSGANGFLFYGGNEQAIKPNGDLKEYSELAGIEYLEDKHQGFHRLGVARLDLDGLSDLANQVKNSFSANATLSLHLDIFLSGYVNTIRNNLDEDKNFLNILFSGGDDMLIVGKWNVVLRFVEQVRSDFRKFIGGKDFCTLSAGIVLVTPKFPIGKSTIQAGEALQAAKDFDNGAKNALTFLGETLSWDEEFGQVKSFKSELSEFLATGKIASGFLQKLIQLQYIKNKHLLNSQLRHKPDLSYRWQTAWQFSKLAERTRDESLKSWLQELGKSLFCHERQYDLLATAARWAELEQRSKENI